MFWTGIKENFRKGGELIETKLFYLYVEIFPELLYGLGGSCRLEVEASKGLMVPLVRHFILWLDYLEPFELF